MAHGKRKGRKGARSRAPVKRPHVMSTRELNATRSPRPSTDPDCTAGEVSAYDCPRSGRTSFADTERDTCEADHDHDHDQHHSDVEEGDHDEGNETTSLYPASQYYGTGAFNSSQLLNRVSDADSSTRSLWAMDLDYREIHGRRYCGEYFMPNDEIEQIRLTLLHQILLHALDDEVTLIDMQDPTHVLDVGTGTGEWAIRLAEMYPACEVVGTDISAIAETQSVPFNVFFEIEDAEEWDRPLDHYDLVHMRSLGGAFRDWTYIYTKAFESIKPGGWIEIQELTSPLGIFFKSLPPDSRIQALLRDVDLAAEKAGRSQDNAHLEPAVLMKAGFVDVTSTEYVFPINGSERTIGKLWLIVCIDAIEAVCLRLLIEHMGWDPDECKAACEAAAGEMADMLKDPVAANGVSMKVRALVGRKPQNAASNHDR